MHILYQMKTRGVELLSDNHMKGLTCVILVHLCRLAVPLFFSLLFLFGIFFYFSGFVFISFRFLVENRQNLINIYIWTTRPPPPPPLTSTVNVTGQLWCLDRIPYCSIAKSRKLILFLK